MGVKRKRARQLQEASQSEPAAAAAVDPTVDHAHQANAQGHARFAEDAELAQQLEDMILQVLQTRKAGATC